jgi:hypothetical protein
VNGELSDTTTFNWPVILRRNGEMKRLIAIGKRYTLCILILLIMLSSTACAKNDAVKNFNTLGSDISKLQTDLSNKIADSETLLNSTNGKDLADPSLLDQLRNEIGSAKNMTVAIPAIASDTAAIKQQIQDLTNKKSELQNQLDSLTSAVSAVQQSRQTLNDQIAAAKEAKIQEAITPKDAHSIIATDGNGNKEKITIHIGKWLKGSDTQLLDKAWKIVGGTGSMPLTGTTYGGTTFTPDDAALVFGTVSIENLTPNFDAKNFAYGNTDVDLNPYLHLSDPYWDGNSICPVYAVQCSNKIITGYQEIGHYDSLITADMTSNRWGPAPFVIGVDAVFAPNYPNGLPLNDCVFTLTSHLGGVEVEGDTKFKIGESW